MKETLEQVIERIADQYAESDEDRKAFEAALREMVAWVYKDAADEILFSDEGEITIAAIRKGE